MVIRFADVEIDAEAHELRRSGDVIDVQPQVLSVLLFLIGHRERVVSKEELLDAVWEHRFVTESALTSRIKSARQAIGDNGRDQRMIRTIHGRGYRFVAEPTTHDEAAPSQGVEPDVTERLAPRVHLPAQSTPFVGRQREVNDLARLLDEPDCRLLTIVGPGGMGKTRLALTLAEHVADRYADGVWFVALAPIADADEMVHAIADVIDLPLDAGSEPAHQVLTHLVNRRLLLLLDNAEHLPDVSFIGELVAAAPHVQVVTTSREQLRLQTEWVFELTGMQTEADATDDRGDEPADAIELFVNSARRVQPDFSLDAAAAAVVQRLCRMVGGMPLAVELAAGWSQMLSVAEIASELERGLELLETELRDVPERHRSMRTVFDTTWEQLDPESRSTFMQLSVFRGGFTREAAEAVTRVRLPTLRRLVATSMLTASEEDRYVVHELLRQYGETRLEESGDRDEIRRRHSDYFLDWLNEQARELRGGAGQREAIESISVEIANVRAAWSDAVGHGRTDSTGHTVEALWLFADARGNAGELGQLIRLDPTIDRDGPFETAALMRLSAHGLAVAHRGQLEEGREILRQVVDRLPATPDDARSRASVGLAHLWHSWVSFLLARNAEADEMARRALSAYTDLGDRWGIARCWYVIGNNDTALGRLSTADEALRESRTLAESIDDRRGVALASRNLAILAGWFGHYEEARTLLDRVASISREFDDRLGTAYALRELGKVNTAEGRAGDAIDVLRRSIEITDDIENRWESAATANDLGNALMSAGELDAAEQALRSSLAAAESAGHRYYAARCIGDLGALALRRGDSVGAADLLGDALTRWRTIGHEPYAAWVLVRLGDVAVHRDDRSAAIRSYAEAILIAERHGLAPVALDAVAGAAGIAIPGPTSERASVLGVVAHHPAAEHRTRLMARRLLESLPPAPSDPDADGSIVDVERQTWRDVAAATARHLAG